MPRFIFGSVLEHGNTNVGIRANIGFGNGVHVQQRSGRCTGTLQPSLGAGEYRSPHRTTNGNVLHNVNGSTVTPHDEVPPPSVYPHSMHRRDYLPRHREEHLVYSSVHWKWRSNQGKSLDKGLMMVVNDEMSRKKTGVSKKKRAIDLDTLAVLLWALLGFVYSSRFLKTRAEALVRCVFHVMMNLYPELFKDILMKESRAFLRKHVMHAYKIQRTIDTEPTGGLNYGSIEGIRKGVEELLRDAPVNWNCMPLLKKVLI
jgi:hypothetical protein